MPTFILPTHAAQALGVRDVLELNLPRLDLGFDADALMRCPQYAQAMAEIAAVRRRMEERRHPSLSQAHRRIVEPALAGKRWREREARRERERQRRHQRRAKMSGVAPTA